MNAKLRQFCVDCDLRAPQNVPTCCALDPTQVFIRFCCEAALLVLSSRVSISLAHKTMKFVSFFGRRLQWLLPLYYFILYVLKSLGIDLYFGSKLNTIDNDFLILLKIQVDVVINKTIYHFVEKSFAFLLVLEHGVGLVGLV